MRGTPCAPPQNQPLRALFGIREGAFRLPNPPLRTGNAPRRYACAAAPRASLSRRTSTGRPNAAPATSAVEARSLP